MLNSIKNVLTRKKLILLALVCSLFACENTAITPRNYDDEGIENPNLPTKPKVYSIEDPNKPKPPMP
ncbi:MAG: hypothetical protein SFT68_03540 [Rickettsiaceae bacterium]|nr:hypothetical protein [Rickettsiaceae bacterium]